MDKSIQIVNENLRQVINGIREHLEKSKNHLSTIDSEMDEKVNLAQKYKDIVIDSKNKINTLEDEITSLERDLDELNQKFGGTDFKEILSAGNKEINSKIIEKRAVIQKESQKILDLTNKARNLKEDLIDLKEKKRILEKEIKNTTIVEKYYSAKVNEIIDYTEAGNDLELYVDNTPQAELMSNNDYQREFVEVSKVLNDHVFEEIDEITINEPDEELVEKALKNVVNNTYDNTSLEIEDIKNAFIKDVKEELDSLKNNNEEKTEVESKEEIKENIVTQVEETPVTPVEEKPVEETPVTPVEEKPVEETPVTPAEEPKEEIATDVKEEVSADGIPEKEFDAITTEDLTKKELETPEDEVKDHEVEESIDMDNPFSDNPIDTEEEDEESNLNELISKTLDNMSYPSFDTDSIDLNLLEDDLSEETEEVKLPGEDDYVEDNSTDSIELDIEDDNDEKEVIKASIDSEDISLLGINMDSLSYADQQYLINHANINELKKTINVLNKHNVSLDKVNDNVKVYTDIYPDTLDKILTILDNSNKKVDTVIPVLDQVDVAKLEDSIQVNSDKDIIDIIVPTVKSNDDSLKSKLNMTDEEFDTLKSSVSDETLTKLNLLSNNVVENFSVLNNLGIENARECLTKYPTNLMLDAKEFKDLLDKYDQDDLVRCINKNAKVFDKI